MGKVNGSGKNWDTHNGNDEKMSSAEFDNFWNKEVVKNQKYREGQMSTEKQNIITNKKNANLESDGYISKTEFDELVNDCNIALGYKTGNLVPVTPAPATPPAPAPSPYTFDPTDTNADFDILDIKDGGADDNLIDKETAIIAYIDAFKAQNPTAMTAAEEALIKNFARKMLANGNTIDWNELYSIITLLDNSKTKDITKDPYSFNLEADLEYLDAQDGTEDDIISAMDTDAYIDNFKKNNAGVTDAEVAYIKTLAKDLMKDGKIEDFRELHIIIELLGNAKRTDITIGNNQGTRAFADTYATPVDPSIKGDYNEIWRAAQSLATAEGNDSLTKDQAEAHLRAYWNEDPNVSEEERNKILNLLDDMYQGQTKRDINEVFSPLLSMMFEAKKGKGVFVQQAEAKAGTETGKYKFNFDPNSADFKADFEALDIFKGAGNNDRIGIDAIKKYINTFAKQKNLSETDKKNLLTSAKALHASGKNISLSEFTTLTQQMKKLG